MTIATVTGRYNRALNEEREVGSANVSDGHERLRRLVIRSDGSINGMITT